MKRDQFNEIERALSALWAIDPGTDRETWVRNLMAAKAAGLNFDEVHKWCAQADNYKNEADCRSVWDSIKDGGITGASLYHFAHAAGWDDGAKQRTERPQSRQVERKAPEPRVTNSYALRLWNSVDRADSFVSKHAYAIRKGINHAFGAGRGTVSGSVVGNNSDCLLVPVRIHGTGAVVSIQAINATGAKQTFGALGDSYLLLGDERSKAAPWIVVEGWATSHSARQAVRESVVVIAFGAGRLDKVAGIVAEYHEPDRLVIFAEPK